MHFQADIDPVDSPVFQQNGNYILQKIHIPQFYNALAAGIII
ncbi:MAG: hypothetical protein JWP12_3541 [Bacteroidetes bacterium]|nr:hypothetical protein [Bacteroidota bacterium]